MEARKRSKYLAVVATCCLGLALVVVVGEGAPQPPSPLKPSSSFLARPATNKTRRLVGQVHRPKELRTGSDQKPSNFSSGLECGLSIYNGGMHLAETSPSELRTKPSQVIGGLNARPGEFPWQVKLVATQDPEGRPFCGGSIMDHQWIVTAAHCVHSCKDGKTKDIANLTVVVGAHERKKPDSGRDHLVERVVVHENYCNALYRSDIALIKVSHPIAFGLTDIGYGSVNAICMPHPETEYQDGEQMSLSGFGRILYDPNVGAHVGIPVPDEHYNEVLQQIKVPFVSDSECEQLFQAKGEDGDRLNFEPEVEICAGGHENEGSCKGDSGGPLMRDLGEAYELAGVVSRGLPCTQEASPTVYAQVDAYLDWIGENSSE